MRHGLMLGSADLIEQYETTLPDGVTIDLSGSTWNRGEDPGDLGALWWKGRRGSGSFTEKKLNDMEAAFGNTDRRLMMVYRLGRVGDGEKHVHNYRPTIRGELDDAFRRDARELASRGMDDTIVRASPEHNLPWGSYPLDRNGDPAPDQYAAAFSRMVSVFRSVSTNFDFIYGAAGKAALTNNPDDLTEESYPPNSPDWNDSWPLPLFLVSCHSTLQNSLTGREDEWTSWSDARRERESNAAFESDTRPWLDRVRDFARDRGLRWGAVEWGVSHVGNSYGSDPWFIENVMEYLRENGAWGQHYWNVFNNRIFPVEDADNRQEWDAWHSAVLEDISGDVQSPSPSGTTIELSVPGFDGTATDYRLTVVGRVSDTGNLNLGGGGGDRIETDGDTETVIATIGAGVDRFTYEGCVGQFTVLSGPDPAVRRDGTAIALDQVADCLAIGGYNRPEKGTRGWDIPLNENFAIIEADIDAVAADLGVSVSVDLKQPQKGTQDWHVPLNENFQRIEAAVQDLAAAASANVQASYTTPSKGTPDWHVPLNENFQQIEANLSAIAESI